MTLNRFLATRQLCGDLHTVGEEVVVVLHPIVHHVPFSTIADALAEFVTMTQTFPVTHSN